MKVLLRTFYKILISIFICFGIFLSRKQSSKICFCGVLKGTQGGPLVKANLLIDHFGQSYLNFAVLYTFSGMPYFTPNVLRIARNKGFPIVHNQNGVFCQGGYGHGWQGRNKEMAEIYRQADLVLFQSEFCRNSSLEFLGKANGFEKIMYNAVDTNVFFPKTTICENETFTFLIAGKIGNRLQTFDSSNSLSKL